MTLIIITIPLMILATSIAVLPLVVMSRADHRHRLAEAAVRDHRFSRQARDG